MDSGELRFQKFRSLASVALSMLLGLLITMPLMSENTKYLPLVGIVAGFLVGRRRKASHAYFYFVLIGCCVMITIIATQTSFISG